MRGKKTEEQKEEEEEKQIKGNAVGLQWRYEREIGEGGREGEKKKIEFLKYLLRREEEEGI